MIYTLEYKLNNETKELTYKSKEDLVFLIKQIQRGLFSIEGEITVSSIEEFEFFKITEQNYNQINSNGEYISLSIDTDGNVDVDICENPYKKDITNEILNERLVSSNKVGNIYLNEKTISILGDEFILKNPSKIRDIFNIILIFKKENDSKTISFIEMESIYSKNKENLKEINIKDFNYTHSRDLLKLKFKEINDEIEKEILYINSRGITINI